MQRYVTTGAVEIVGVMEEHKNPIHDKFKKGVVYPQKPGNPKPTTMYRRALPTG
jgi:hypothetical protein